jgi:hypothetical protein
MKAELASGGATVDVEYWETVLKELATYQQRAAVFERYQKALKVKLGKLPAAEGFYAKTQMTEADEQWDSRQTLVSASHLAATCL